MKKIHLWQARLKTLLGQWPGLVHSSPRQSCSCPSLASHIGQGLVCPLSAGFSRLPAHSLTSMCPHSTAWTWILDRSFLCHHCQWFFRRSFILSHSPCIRKYTQMSKVSQKKSSLTTTPRGNHFLAQVKSLWVSSSGVIVRCWSWWRSLSIQRLHSPSPYELPSYGWWLASKPFAVIIPTIETHSLSVTVCYSNFM